MKNDGGSAFPKPRDPYPNCDGVTHPSPATGMSLRDYFAGQALASIPIRSWDDIGNGEALIKAWAKCAYAVADAMLVQRSLQVTEGERS